MTSTMNAVTLDEPALAPLPPKQFIRPRFAAENPETGEFLWQILNKEGDHMQYVVADREGEPRRYLNWMTFKEAKADIGVIPPGTLVFRTRRRKDDVAIAAE